MTIDLSMLLAGLLGIGFLCQWLAWRVRVPAILFLLLSGLALGPIAHIIDPDQLLGDLLFPVVSLSVAVILFEGSINLRFAELSDIGRAVRGLVSYGAVVASLGLALAAHWLAGLDWSLAFLFGALTCVTGPTVVMPMLRAVRPNRRISNLLRWEGIVIDPLGALFAVLVFEAIVSQLAEGETHPVLVFLQTVAIGAAVGVAAALALAALLRRQLIPEYLQSYAALAAVLAAFALAEFGAHESGLLTVTVMGMMLGNARGIHIDTILHFKEHLSTLLVSILFILLAARLMWPLPAATLWAGVLVYLAAQFVIRPVSVWISTLGSSLSWQERVLVAWISPRGIVAASVAALFALKLSALGLPGAETLVPLVFLLIIATVVVQSATSRTLAKALGVAEPEPKGVLIFGANRVAREVAVALKAQGIQTLVADDDWDGIRAARMLGLATWFGNPNSQHAERNLDLTGLGRLLAMSSQRESNVLACLHYRSEFGRNRIYRLRNLGPSERSQRASFSDTLLAPALFSEDMTLSHFNDRLDAGWRIRTTQLSDTFGWSEFVARYGNEAHLLFALTDKGVLRPASSRRVPEPRTGWTVIALTPPVDSNSQATNGENQANPEAPPVPKQARNDKA